MGSAAYAHVFTLYNPSTAPVLHYHGQLHFVHSVDCQAARCQSTSGNWDESRLPLPIPPLGWGGGGPDHATMSPVPAAASPCWCADTWITTGVFFHGELDLVPNVWSALAGQLMTHSLLGVQHDAGGSLLYMSDGDYIYPPLQRTTVSIDQLFGLTLVTFSLWVLY